MGFNLNLNIQIQIKDKGQTKQIIREKIFVTFGYRSRSWFVATRNNSGREGNGREDIFVSAGLLNRFLGIWLCKVGQKN